MFADRKVRLGVAALAAATFVAFMVARAPSAARPQPPLPGAGSQTEPLETVASPTPHPSGALPDQVGRRNYAIATTALRGLPPVAGPGDRFDLWVAWDRPVTRQPRVQRLLRAVVLDSIVPGITPEAPPVAILSLKPAQIPDLLFGEQWGVLSVAMLPGRGP